MPVPCEKIATNGSIRLLRRGGYALCRVKGSIFLDRWPDAFEGTEFLLMWFQNLSCGIQYITI